MTRTRIGFLVIAVLAAIAIAYAAVTAVSFNHKAEAAVTNQFHLDCDLHDVARIDPIRPDVDHLHALFGNRGVSDTSTYESLVSNKDTTCEQSFVTSSYWISATWWGKIRVDPFRIAVYYHAPPNSDPRHIPDGLKMLATRDNGEITFKCGKDPTKSTTTPPYGCKQDEFRIVMKFPECWDGDSLAPESLKEASGASCPAGYDRIVNLRISFHYNNPFTSGAGLPSPLKVSSGADMRTDWNSLLADAFEANQQPEFNDTIEKCVMQNQSLPICDRAP